MGRVSSKPDRAQVVTDLSYPAEAGLPFIQVHEVVKDRVAARIGEIGPDSIAEEMEIRPDDILISINGHPINDILDYQFDCRTKSDRGIFQIKYLLPLIFQSLLEVVPY